MNNANINRFVIRHLNRSSVTKKAIILFSAMLFLLLYSSLSVAETRVYYAGFAFSSDHGDIESSFPYTTSILELKNEKGVPLLEIELGKKIVSVDNPKFKILTDTLGDYKTGEAISLAFALSWENVSTEGVGAWTKLIVDIHAQVLIFDFSEMRLIGTYPIRVQIRDAVEGEVNDEYVRDLIYNIYFSEGPKNIFNLFVRQLNSIDIRSYYAHYLQVSSVIFEDKALETMSSESINHESFGNFLAGSLGSFLSYNENISILPYSKGEAIGGSMAARFSNGDVYHLEIPPPDYTIDLTVRGFRKIHVGSNKSQTVWAYGSFIRIKMEQPDSGFVYLDAPFKFAASKVTPPGVEEPDDWTAFQESILSLLNQFTLQISRIDKKWLDKWSEGAIVREQMSEASRIISLCR